MKNSLGLWLFKNNLLYDPVGSPIGFIRLEGNAQKELRKKKAVELLNSYSADQVIPLLRASSNTPLADGLEDHYVQQPSIRELEAWNIVRTSRVGEDWEKIKDISSLKETMFLNKCLEQKSDCVPYPSVEKVTDYFFKKGKQEGSNGALGHCMRNRPRTNPLPEFYET